VTQSPPPYGTIVQTGISSTSDSMFINSDQRVIVDTNFPSTPIITSVVTANREITLGFLIEDDGGFPLTDQEYSLDGGDNWVSIGTSATSILLDSLNNGVEYSIQIRATNEKGTSPITTVKATPNP